MNTWFSAPWLFSECAMYRKIHESMLSLADWGQYDVFLLQKQQAFEDCKESMHSLLKRLLSESDFTSERVIKTYMDASLWGNQVDLSLFSHATTGLNLKSQDENMVINHSDRCVQKIKQVGKREKADVVIVLDNAGFELVSDLCLAHCIMMQNEKERDSFRIHFHVKKHPWFVSDVTINDFYWTLDEIKKMGYESLVNTWSNWLEHGRWILKEDAFWTTPLSFWHLNMQDVTGSDLTIFKGDLNYRKVNKLFVLIIDGLRCRMAVSYTIS
jgi:uncharacterized protein with ATP-grasp and redox domains